jgi:hypothetical protein
MEVTAQASSIATEVTKWRHKLIFLLSKNEILFYSLKQYRANDLACLNHTIDFQNFK